MYELQNSPEDDFSKSPISGVNPDRLAQASTSLYIQQLETELWLERFLNCLKHKLDQSLTSCLKLRATTPHAVKAQVEEKIFQTTVSELRTALGSATVAIALPDSTDLEGSSPFRSVPLSSEQTFKISHIAPHKSQRSAVHASSVFLSTGKEFRLTLGLSITALELQHLHVQKKKQDTGNATAPQPEKTWQRAWPIPAEQGVLGWLIVVLTPAQLKLKHLEIGGEQLWSELIQRVIAECALIAQHAKLLQLECLHCQKLELQNQELVRANRLKSEFLANTSHEIRTPLSSILGFTHLLQEQGYSSGNSRHQEYLNIIRSSGQHLLALINDILDLSKIEANQLELQWEVVHIPELCRSVLSLVKEKAYGKGLQLRLDIDPDATTFIADSLRLKQMLFNLLANALKFTTTGAVGLRVKLAGLFLHFTVWDTGIGIAQEQQQQLFRPYSQIANAVVSNGEGTGLGLALTQRLAELHNGWVEVQSELSQGSQFTLVLPLTPQVCSEEELPEQRELAVVPSSCNLLLEATQLATITPQTASAKVLSPAQGKLHKTSSIGQAPGQQKGAVNGCSPKKVKPSTHKTTAPLPAKVATPSSSAATSTDVSTLRGCRVLLVEDNLLNAKLMITYLNKIGCEVSWAKAGPEMWQKLATALPDLILMDINLPGVDGLTLIQQIQTSERYQAVPIIAQTAMAMLGDRDACLQAGATQYISKPIDFKVLEKLILQYTRPSCVMEAEKVF